MIDVNGFKKWLEDTTEFTDCVIRDTVSRIKRADSILKWRDDETYKFYLEKEIAFNVLSVSVKSQLRRAVQLYETYLDSTKK